MGSFTKAVLLQLMIVLLADLFTEMETVKHKFSSSRKFDAKNADCPHVRLKNGLTIIGQINKTDEGTTYHSYRGIPYAIPPIEDLRFKPPLPITKNQSGETMHAQKDSPICTQSVMPTLIEGSEDCLYINVYIPQISNTNSSNLSVMVWIYGGGFALGDSTYARYGPDYFLDEGVLFVSFNYRVSIFGYLSTEDLASPGNYASKDQILALKWVKENVEAFGGNCNDITVFGESAGSVSISILTQTPLAKGLFNRAIMESGTSLNQWSLTRNAKAVAMNVAKILGIRTENTTELVKELRKVDHKKLQLATGTAYLQELFEVNLLDGLPIGPVMEPPNPNAVLVNKSYEQLSEGRFYHVPYLMGFNSMEAIPFVEALNNLRLYLVNYDVNPTALVPVSMNVVEEDIKVKVNSIIKSHYFGMVPIALSEEKLLQFISDDLFSRPILEAARLYSEFSPVYLYVFSYQGPLDTFYRKTTSHVKGTGHGDDLYFLFKEAQVKVKPSKHDLLTRKRMIRLWTNFAKFGNPTPNSDPLLQNVTWPLTSSAPNNGLAYLDICDNLTVGADPQWKNFKFWLSLFKKYGNPPFSTF